MLLIVPLVLLGMIIASAVLLNLGIIEESWKLLWVAAILSLLFSIVTGFSIGPFVFLLTCVQLACALAARWRLGGWGWLGLIAASGLIWCLIVPFQLLVARWVPLLLAFLAVTLIAALATLFYSGRPEGAEG